MWVVATIILLLTLWYIYKKMSTAPDRGPPVAPGSMPLIGHMFSIDWDHMHEHFKKVGEEFSHVFKVRMPGQEMIYITDYELIEKILNDDNFADRPIMPEMELWHYGGARGLSDSSGQEWKEQSRFALSTLASLGYGKSVMHETILLEADKLCQHIKDSMTDGRMVVEVKNLLKYVTGSTITTIVTGRTYPWGSEEIIKVQTALDDVVEGMFDPRVALAKKFPILAQLPGDMFVIKKFQAGIAAVDQLFRRIVEEKKKTFDPDLEPEDFINAYLLELHRRRNEQGQSTFSPDQLITCAVNLFVAGLGTTTTALDWGILQMVLNPEIQERVYQELNEKTGTVVSIDDKAKTPYVEAVLNEVLRLGGDTTLPHTPRKRTTLAGYELKPGDVIFPSIYAVHRGARYFEKPLEFNPDRFLEGGEVSGRETSHFLPFGIGKRSCMAVAMAKSEVYLVFCALMKNFKFSPKDPDNPPTDRPFCGFIMAPYTFECLVEKR